MILPNRDILLTVEPECAGQRLDRYLARRIGHRSRTWLKGLIREGLLSISQVQPGNSAPLRVKPSTAVQGGMEILIRQSHKPQPAERGADPRHPLTVLYEDDALLVVDKPAGMLVHPAGATFHETLIIQLRARSPDVPLHLGHRLDRETSGVLVVARGDEPNRRLKAAFKARRIRKGYLAIVRGLPPWERTLCEAPMGPGEEEVRIRQVVREDGAAARTLFTVVRPVKGGALVACEPHTGRLHQLRVHLEHLGFPILGDKIYGTDGSPFIRFREEGLTPELEASLGHWRQALHAHWIELAHPMTGEWLRFTAPLAPDLAPLVGEDSEIEALN